MKVMLELTNKTGVVIKGNRTLTKNISNAKVIPRAEEWVELAEGWASANVDTVVYRHDLGDVVVRLSCYMSTEEWSELKKKHGWK